MQAILKSKYTSLTIIAILLFFLFKGILDTYAFTDGYEFIFNADSTDFINVFLQQGRSVSGWIIKQIYPHLHYVSDLSKLRILNLICLFLSAVLIYNILIRNNIKSFHSLVIIILFITSPFASIVVHWEAASSSIWGYPVALLSGELIFTNFLNKNKIEKKRFDLILYSGITLGITSLFIYQPAYTAFIFPAFLHFITGQKREVIWKFLLLHLTIYGIYFLLFKFQMNQLHLTPNERSGMTISFYKIYWFLKGALFMSFHYNIIFASNAIIKAISITSIIFIAYYIYAKTKDSNRNEKLIFLGMFLTFYGLAYFPSIVSKDNWISYRTMGTLTLLSSVLLTSSIASFPIKKFQYNDLVISIIAILFIWKSYENNSSFTNIAAKEYANAKTIIAEKLKQGYPKKILVIMPEEKFLEHQKILSNIVTDEFGKLSNTVDWAPSFFVSQIIFELTNDKLKTRNLDISHYPRISLPADSIVQQNDWVLDIEKIYLGK
jgi:hypothetical protein